MSHHYTYIQAIGQGWPQVKCSCVGDCDAYTDIVWEAGPPLPTQAELDAWISTAEISEKTREIKQERDRRKVGGVYVATVDKWFSTDDSSRLQYMGIMIAGNTLPFGIMWKTLDGTSVEMTQTLATQISQAIIAKDIAIFNVSEQHATQATSSPHPALYDFIDNSPAWPQIYGE